MTNQKKEERRAVLGSKVGGSLLGSALISLLLTLLVSAFTLFAAAIVFSFKPEGTSHIDTVGCILGALMALLGGLLAGKRQKHTGALSGVIFGLMFVAVLLLVGHMCGGGTPLWKRTVAYGIFLLLSALGGALGTVEVGKRHHKRKRR